MSGTQIAWLITLLALGPGLGGCAHLDLGLADFMSGDRGPRSAQLPAGYTLRSLVIAQGGRSIGVTYAHHPDSRAVILFCGGNAFRRSTNTELYATSWVSACLKIYSTSGNAGCS